MININAFKKLKGTKLIIPTTDWIDGKEEKRIRTEVFHMSQNAFAEALGMTKKAIEKWESGTNQLAGSVRKLLYLLNRHPELMNDLYHFDDELNRGVKIDADYSLHTEKNNTFVFAFKNNQLTIEESPYYVHAE